jgi:hypothetical protein
LRHQPQLIGKDVLKWAMEMQKVAQARR